MRLLILLNLVLLLQACHYSCFNCTGAYYTSCLSCNNQKALTIVQDPATLPSAYWSSVYSTGTCVDTMSDSANALGIFLFIVLSLVYSIIGTKEAFFLYLSFQTYGLYNLVEIAWINPIGYVLQAFQHFMIWNVIGSGYKDTDYVLFTNKRHRLDIFLKQSQIGQNLALIAAFTILSLALLIVICIVTVRRKKQAQKEQKQKGSNILQQLSQQKRLTSNQQRSSSKGNSQERQKQQIKEQVKQDQQKPTCWERFSQKVLANIAKVLLIIMFLMVQETSLVLLVSLVFNNSKAVVVVSVIYLHILIFAMSYAYYYRVQYFKEKNVMYACFAKKIIMPILVVVPIRYQLLFILFIIAFLVIQIVIDCYNGFYNKFSRLALYKGVDILCTILLIVCFAVEHQEYGYGSTRAASIAAVFVLGFNMALFFCVEVPMGIKERFFSSQQQQQQEENEESIQNQLKALPDNTQNQDINNNHTKPFSLTDLVDMVSSDNRQHKDFNHQEDKKTKQDFNSIQRSIFEPQQGKNNHNERVKSSEQPQQILQRQLPAKKKKRKQIIDKQLRLRYGI